MSRSADLWFVGRSAAVRAGKRADAADRQKATVCAALDL